MSRAARIAALASTGTLTAREIAERVGVTTWAVQKQLHRAGLRLTRGRPPKSRHESPAARHRRELRQQIQNARRRVGTPQPDLVPRAAPNVPLTVRWRCCDGRLVIGPATCPACGEAPRWARDVRAA